MAPKLLWIAIIHVLLWNFMFSVSESIELNEEPNLEPEHKTHNEPLPDSDGDVGNFTTLAQDEPVVTIKKHITRCSRNHAHENHEPHKPSDLISSEWQLKSAPPNYAYDHSTVQNSNSNDKKKIDINLHTVIYQNPLSYPPAPLSQTGIEANQKHTVLDSNLLDKLNKVKSLISTRTHKPVALKIIPEKLLDESLHYRPALAPFNYPRLPSKPKPDVLNPFTRPATEVHDYDVNTAVLMKDNDKLISPFKKLIELSPELPYTNAYLNNSTVENKPSFPPLPAISQKPVGISFDKHVPPFAYRPAPSTQLMKIPVARPILLPVTVKKEYPTNERPLLQQANIVGSSSRPNIAVNNGIAEPTPQPIVIEKEVSITLPYKEPQKTVYLPPSLPVITSTDAETAHKQIPVDKEVSTFATNGQNQPIAADLSLQSPQLVNNNVDKVSIYQPAPEEIMVPANVPYEQPRPINGLSSPPQIVETFNGESTSQIMPIEKGLSLSEPYGKPRPTINFSQLPQIPQLQQIKMQKVITIPLAYKQPKIGLAAPPKLIKTFNTELVSQPISQEKKISLYELNYQQRPTMVLPSLPPLTKTTTSGY